MDALRYAEPSIRTLLVEGSFIVLLNVVNHVLDSLIFCGLVGQLLLGVIYGRPLANWLPETFQLILEDLGYLGLVAIVYEGMSSFDISLSTAEDTQAVCTPTWVACVKTSAYLWAWPRLAYLHPSPCRSYLYLWLMLPRCKPLLAGPLSVLPRKRHGSNRRSG